MKLDCALTDAESLRDCLVAPSGHQMLEYLELPRSQFRQDVAVR